MARGTTVTARAAQAVLAAPREAVEELLSINQAADRAGVSRRSIYTWLKAGKIRAVRTAGGSVRVVAQSLFRRVDDHA